MCEQLWALLQSEKGKTLLERINSKKKCKKRLISGEICGKPYGTCIHKFIPTKFGDRKQ